jgi:CubicO group peptidase (beta-lactamase class C family)
MSDGARRVEHGLRPDDQPDQGPYTLQERMAHYGITGLSVAVISNFGVEWAKSYGLANADTQAAVTPRTLFQAASISKSVATVGALRAVAEGRLSLDDDINRFLCSWQLPVNEHTAAAPVTLRRLLGHTAGTTVSGFRGYAAGEVVPTLRQILDGEAPANTPPIRVDLRPGTEWRYSGGGYCIVQQALVDIYRRPFPELMQAFVLDPTGMTRSLYSERLSSRRQAVGAGHRSDGSVIPGKWHAYPELAAAGLWSTPTDLARFAIAMQRTLRGEEAGAFSKAIAQEMVSTTVADGYGLGLFVDRRGDEVYYGHDGANDGYRCTMRWHQSAGCGAIIMTNSDNGGAVLPELMAAIAAEYEWPGYRPRGRE